MADFFAPAGDVYTPVKGKHNRTGEEKFSAHVDGATYGIVPHDPFASPCITQRFKSDVISTLLTVSTLHMKNTDTTL